MPGGVKHYSCWMADIGALPIVRFALIRAISRLSGLSNKADIPLDFVRNGSIGVHVNSGRQDQLHAPIG